MRDRIEALPKRDPIEVARLIASVAQDPDPKLRYLVGRDAFAQAALHSVPARGRDALLGRFMGLDAKS